MSTAQPNRLLPKRLEDGSYAPWVYSYDAFGVLVRAEGVDLIDPLPEGSIVFPSGEALSEALGLSEDANFCGGYRSYHSVVGVWLNEDGSITAPTRGGHSRADEHANADQ
jgi:hypothetical protein